MRTVTFQSVYEGVLRRHGLDPLTYNAGQSTARAIAEKITRRIKHGWSGWIFNEFTVTEERAFRTPWSNTRQYKRVGIENGQPDELYYGLGAVPGYYRVLKSAPNDPPIGLPPETGNIAYFELFTPEPFTDRDQLDRNPIGEVLGVYSGNPSLETDCALSIAVPFRPSEHGIRILGDSNIPLTVFVWYRIVPPRFTKRPWISGKTYFAGDLAYYNGDCYSVLATSTTDTPGTTANWMLSPVPETLAEYLVAGAYADCLKETILNGLDPQSRAVNITLAENDAQTYLDRECDKLIAQGQKHFYGGNAWWRWYGMWNPQPWGGDTVTLITWPVINTHSPPFPPHPAPPPPLPPTPDITEPPPQLSGPLTYAPNVKSLDGSIAPGISIIPTALAGIDSMVIIYTGEQARLTAGAADPGNPGHFVPGDFDPVVNNKHWEQTI